MASPLTQFPIVLTLDGKFTFLTSCSQPSIPAISWTYGSGDTETDLREGLAFSQRVRSGSHMPEYEAAKLAINLTALLLCKGNIHDAIDAGLAAEHELVTALNSGKYIGLDDLHVLALAVSRYNMALIVPRMTGLDQAAELFSSVRQEAADTLGTIRRTDRDNYAFVAAAVSSLEHLRL